MRPKPALIMRARALTVSVLAVPGTPSISACPSASKATRICSIGSSWPTITLRSSCWICAIVEETYSGMGRVFFLLRQYTTRPTDVHCCFETSKIRSFGGLPDVTSARSQSQRAFDLTQSLRHAQRFFRSRWRAVDRLFTVSHQRFKL